MRTTRYSPTAGKLWKVLPGAIALTISSTAIWPNIGHSEELVESHPGISIEPMYSEAVIAYNAKQPAEALKILDAVLKAKPDYLQALELKALVLRSLGKKEESQANYEALIKSAPPEKAAAYHFGLGVLLYTEKKGDAAAPHFEEALRRDFNVDASHFFLGLHYFALTNRPGNSAEAQKHFEAVAAGSSDELKPAAHYYLGLISYKAGNGGEGTFELIEARSIASGMGDNPLAKDIGDAVSKVLAPLGKAQWFGNATFLGSYNSNISSSPNDSTGQAQTTNLGTPQGLLVAGFGRMSSPLDPLQWVASYRGTFNYNLNSATSTYDFLTHTVDLYLTRNPLARTQYGMKLEGNFNLQNQAPGFTWYSVTGEVGPYIRRALGRGTLLSAELYYRPATFPGAAGIYDQSGHSLIARTTLQIDHGDTWWNPVGTFALEKNRTDGSVYRDWAMDFLFSDVLHLGARNAVTASAALNLYAYQESDQQRFDKLISLRADWIHTLENAHWTVIGDLAYTNNFSNLADLYHYNQVAISAGVGYTF